MLTDFYKFKRITNQTHKKNKLEVFPIYNNKLNPETYGIISRLYQTKTAHKTLTTPLFDSQAGCSINRFIVIHGDVF